MPLVHNYVRRRVCDPRVHIHHDDLISEGYIGLMEAIYRFDPKKGTRFSTYAAYWIRQKINRFLYSSFLIRPPEAVAQSLNKSNKFNERMIDEYKDILRKKYPRAWRQMEAAYRCMRFVVPILSTRGIEYEHEGIKNAANEDTISLLEKVPIFDFKDLLDKKSRLFRKKHLAIIKYHFGVMDRIPKTYRQTGKHFNLSGQYIHNVIRRNIRLLRDLVLNN